MVTLAPIFTTANIGRQHSATLQKILSINIKQHLKCCSLHLAAIRIRFGVNSGTLQHICFQQQLIFSYSQYWLSKLSHANIRANIRCLLLSIIEAIFSAYLQPTKSWNYAFQCSKGLLNTNFLKRWNRTLHLENFWDFDFLLLKRYFII